MRLCHAQPELIDPAATQGAAIERAQGVVIHGPPGRLGERVLFASPAAGRRGIVPGMPLAEATALEMAGGQSKVRGPLARLHFAMHDPAADAAAGAPAQSCQRHSPLVGWEEFSTAVGIVLGPDTLLLEIGNCAHLFQGEEPWPTTIARDWRRRGFAVRVAVADTIGAAGPPRITANFRPPRLAWCLVGQSESFLASARRGGAAAAARNAGLLDELGLRRIAQLLALPRASLPSRLGGARARSIGPRAGDRQRGDCRHLCRPAAGSRLDV